MDLSEPSALILGAHSQRVRICVCPREQRKAYFLYSLAGRRRLSLWPVKNVVNMSAAQSAPFCDSYVD